jgi:hypothetical protein
MFRGDDVTMSRKTLILLAVLILAHALPAEAALLCAYSGPDAADGYLEVSDFEVIGPEPLRVGDTVTVAFTLKATEVPVQFGELWHLPRRLPKFPCNSMIMGCLWQQETLMVWTEASGGTLGICTRITGYRGARV